MAFSNGYTYRKKITVDATKVSGSGSLTDFPVLVSHTDTALKTVANSGKVENASGYDIRFETTGGTELDYERILYVATTGQIIVWLQATIDGTTSTEVYMYYGNSSISTDQSDPTGTWDANFKGTWHMIEDPTSVSVRASSKNDDATGTALSVTAPTGTETGDFVVVMAHANGQTTIADNNKTISIANLTSGSDTDAGSTATTASISPSANKLILLSVASRTAISTDPNQPTVTGNGLTWEVVNSIVYDTTSSSRRRITLFRAMGSSPSSGAISIDFGGQAQDDAVVWNVDEVTGADTSGTNGSGAIVQSVTGKDEAAPAGLTVTLASFGNSNNATFGTFATDNNTTFTAGSGFSILAQHTAGANTMAIVSEYKATNDTTVDIGSTGSVGGIAVEIKANSGFTIAPNFTDYKPNTTNGHTMTLFSRTIQAGDPSTYNFTSGASGRWSVIAITFKSDGVIAFDVAPNTANAANDDSASTGTINAPTITTGVADTIHVVFNGWDTSAYGTITTPSGYTLLQNANTDGEPLHASYKAIATASATGAVSIANTEFAAMIASSFSVKATAQLLDSTSNNYDMTTAGSMTSGDLVTGQVYKGIDFDGTDDEAKNTAWASVISGNSAFTIEHWFNIASTPNSQMVAWGEAGASNLCSTGTYGNNIGFLGYANDHLVSAAPYDDSVWHHLAVTHNGTTVKVIIDGAEVLSESMTLGTNAGQDLYFARWKDGGFYPAKLEEIRISDTARSNDWMITTYETAKNPSTFYSLGTEETSGGGASATQTLMMMGCGV